jgi:hypothetical protein
MTEKKDSTNPVPGSDCSGGYTVRLGPKSIDQDCLDLIVLGSKPRLRIDELLIKLGQENTII